ncbi:EamA family transporter [uncultured Muribaculum sp.]|uniref:DMT family transporter n=1 Tax=uncultured Muribaculum sp. TaxID=1918613 RepID=UPI0025DC50E4|nr:EamA family transporter [uncultured Muribaculum sp.]
MRQISNRTKGYACAAIAACTYGINPLLALPLYAEGMNADSVLFFRYGFATVMLWVIMHAMRKPFSLQRRQLPAMTIAAILMALSSLLLFEAYNHMDVGIASTLLFVYPVMVALINTIFYRERLSAVTISAIAMATAGIMLLYRGDGTATLSVTGTVLVMLSALSYAVYMVAVNRTSLCRMDSMPMTFYSVAIGIAVFVAGMAWHGFTPVTGTLGWTCALSLALFPTIVSLIAMVAAIHKIGSTPTAILGALEPVTALVIGVCVFGEHLSLGACIGIVLVVGSVTMLIAARPAARLVKQFIHSRRRH